MNFPTLFEHKKTHFQNFNFVSVFSWEEMEKNQLPENIEFDFFKTSFGKVLIATFEGKVCRITFENEELEAEKKLKAEFPSFRVTRTKNQVQQNALTYFSKETKNIKSLPLILKGSDFQLKVWNELLKIPLGSLSTYQEIAQKIGQPKAFRAVGTAIGKNHIAFIVPCHRVIQVSGKIGGYRWGKTRKTDIINWEREVFS